MLKGGYRWGRLLLLALSSLAAAPLHAEEFTVTSLQTRLQAQVYVMDAHVEYRFTKRALDAFGNGIPLTLQLDINVDRKRSWLPDETIASLQQLYQLRYHALSHQYMVRNINSGALYLYQSQAEAIDSLKEIANFPIIDANLIKGSERYEIELRIKLDTESLPTPLRLISYVTPDWHLSSDWTTWSLTR